MAAKFEVFQSSKNDNYYFRLKSANGKIILQSEGYSTKNNCLKGIDSVKKYAIYDKAYQTTDSHFNLKSDNGQIVGSSQSYKLKASRDKGMASVKKNAPNADIKDLSV